MANTDINGAGMFVSILCLKAEVIEQFKTITQANIS